MKRLLALAMLLLGLATAPLHAQSLPEICNKKKSCFITFDGSERGFCQAYVEGRSCFMSLDGEDRGWCQHLREGKSCFMALDGEARKDCEANRIPREHRHWMRMCSYW